MACGSSRGTRVALETTAPTGGASSALAIAAVFTVARMHGPDGVVTSSEASTARSGTATSSFAPAGTSRLYRLPRAGTSRFASAVPSSLRQSPERC